MEPIKVEVGQYRVIDKGFLKGTFSLHILPQGQKILDCKLFEKDGGKWFAFPQKEVKREGQKSEYFPLVSYTNKEYLAALQVAVLEALKTATPMESYDKNSASSSRTAKVSSNTPPDWF